MSYTERNDYEVQFDQAITEQTREADDIQAISRMVAERGPRWVIDIVFHVVSRSIDPSGWAPLSKALDGVRALLPPYLRING